MVGAEATEKVLLPKFFYLCEDGVWGVRKACADVFMPVSCVCSPSVRQAELSPLFLNLLKDQSRWVRMAAFQGLGPFISTFADPLITALLQNQNGEIVITDPDQLAERLAKVVAVANEVAERDQKETREREETEMDLSLDEVRTVIQLEEAGGDTSFEEKRAKTYEEPVEYTAFLFWREPVGDIFVEDIDILEDLDVIETQQVEHKENEITKVIHEATIEEVKNELSTLDTESSTDNDGDNNKESVDKVSEAADLILEAHVSDTLEKEDSNDSSDEESERGEEMTSSPLQSRPTYAQALQVHIKYTPKK